MKMSVFTYLKKKIFQYYDWIIYFIIGCFMTCPFLIKIHFDGDAYALLSSGYSGYATVFMRSGRVITALSYHLFDLIHLSYNVLAIASVFLANIFLASACTLFHRTTLRIKKIQRTDIVVFVCSTVLIFYNFFTMEFFGFIEAYSLCLGLLFAMLGVKQFLHGTRRGYFLSILFAIFASFCYQSVLSVYVLLLALLAFLKWKQKGKDKKIFEIIKEGILAYSIYAFCYIVSFAVMKGYTAWTGLVSGKDGAIDILSNIHSIRNVFMSAADGLFGYINPIYFYPVVVGLILVNILKALYNKEYESILWMFIIVLVGILTPFIPNLFLPDAANYVAPRMLPSFPAVIGVLGVFYLCNFERENTYIRDVLVMLILFFSIVNVCNYNWTLRNANGKYYQDMRHVNAIYDKIREYEDETGAYVDTIYYTKDDYVPYYYSEVALKNAYTYRMYAYDWITCAAINAFWEGRSFNIIPMEEEDKERMFGESVNYTDLNDEEFVFEGNTLYLLLY